MHHCHLAICCNLRKVFLTFGGQKTIYQKSKNYIKRAMHYLERKGFEFSADSVKMDDKNELMEIYLKEEIMSFAIHLLQR